VERLGLAYSIHATLETFADAGLLAVEGACSPPKLRRVISEVLRILGDLRERPVDGDELRRAQRRHRMSLGFALDSPAELVGWFGAGEVLGAVEGLEHRCRRVERVAPADVQRVAARAFRGRHLLAVAVGPGARPARRAIQGALRGSRLP